MQIAQLLEKRNNALEGGDDMDLASLHVLDACHNELTDFTGAESYTKLSMLLASHNGLSRLSLVSLCLLTTLWHILFAWRSADRS